MSCPVGTFTTLGPPGSCTTRRDNAHVPELPDIELYLACCGAGSPESAHSLAAYQSVFSCGPSNLSGEFVGRLVTELERLGKRIVIGFEGDLYAVIHLMIAAACAGDPGSGRAGADRAGRPRFRLRSAPGHRGGLEKRAALHMVRGRAALAEHDRGGLEPLAAGPETLQARSRERTTPSSAR